MKRLFFCCLMLFIFSVVLLAGPWKSYKAFQEYVSLKNKAKQADADGDTFTAVTNYLKAADIASKSADINIQAWQLNNAAYSLISQFKKLVNYEEKLQKLTEMKPGKEKITFQKELAEMLNLQFSLLEEAHGILNRAKDLGEELEAKEKIQSNIDFITWVKEFIGNNLSETKEVEEKE